jgi:hypothetical protein
MARYLSAEWFAEAASGGALARPVDLVLEQVVRGTPDGTVVYRVEVAGDEARVVWPVADDAGAADLRISTDWDTAVALARGDLSAQRALMEGRLRVRGRSDQLGDAPTALAGVDAVPAVVRLHTSFGES